MRIPLFCRSSGAAILALLLNLATLCAPVATAAERSPRGDYHAASGVPVAIDSEHLIDLYQSVPGLRIIDSRLHEDHALGYIEHSHNLPLGDTGCESLSRIAGSIDQALVFYCNGKGIDTSIEAIQIASSCGYTRLFWLNGGFIEWQDKDYPYLVE